VREKTKIEAWQVWIGRARAAINWGGLAQKKLPILRQGLRMFMPDIAKSGWFRSHPIGC
jgi:phage tail protein X